jgi:hypothetical protein
MPKLSIGRIQRAARITSLIFGIVPILVFWGSTIHLLIAKYYGFASHTLTLLDIKMAFEGQLLTGLYIGGPLLLAICVAERKPLIGAIIMLILATYFILIPFTSYDMDKLAASVGLIYIAPGLLYLASWRRGRL